MHVWGKNIPERGLADAGSVLGMCLAHAVGTRVVDEATRVIPLRIFRPLRGYWLFYEMESN